MKQRDGFEEAIIVPLILGVMLFGALYYIAQGIEAVGGMEAIDKYLCSLSDNEPRSCRKWKEHK
jgi:hypothetical protein